MKIIVCVKVVPKADEVRLDPTTKTLVREGVQSEINPADKNALELALKLKDSEGGEVIAMSMGPPMFEPYLKLAVAMGADDAILLSDKAFAGADTYATSFVLAKAIEKVGDYDLVVCGAESSDSSTGQVPPSIAEWLKIPQVTYVSDVKISGDRVIAKRIVKGGYEIVESSIPAVVSVELGCNTPRFPDFRRKRWAEREFRVKVWDRELLGLSEDQVGKKASLTSVIELKEAKVKPRERRFIRGDAEKTASHLLEIIKPYIKD